MKHDSPLRYPGGKSLLAPLLAETIKMNGLSGCSYYEPFAGGAGAALRLLREGFVSDIHLNDLDVHIFAFWHVVLNEPERLVEKIFFTPINIMEWKKQRDIYQCGNARRRFELGFSAFYLNRCNRSGILEGAAPIGGYEQTGKWKINARFTRETLAERIMAIADKRKCIRISNMDALDFLAKNLPRGNKRKRVFVYLDPPYHTHGSRLYMSSYEDKDHRNLADYMQRQRTLNWVMSYDDAAAIRDIYTKSNISPLPVRYNLQRKQNATELLISPSHVKLPASVRPSEGHMQFAVSA